MTKPIQEQFGNVLISAIANFARADLKSADTLEANEFCHVGDVAMRACMAEVFYGARWIYKLGLATLARNEERAAHVRAQIRDYASVIEGLLSDMVAHAIRNRHVQGTQYTWKYPAKKQGRITWNVAAPEAQLEKQSFAWLITIAEDFGIITPHIAKSLHSLRGERNKVHIRKMAAMGPRAYLRESQRAFALVYGTIEATKLWRSNHN